MEKKTIGSLILALRKANGMTQKDLAERLHVSDKAVSRWERDESAPDLSLIPMIAEIFNITCDELLKGTCNPKEKATTDSEENPSAKGERECRHILASKMNLYKILSVVDIGITLLGLLVTAIFNFNMLHAWIGSRIAFLIGSVFYLSSAVLEAIIIFIAFVSVSNCGLQQEDILQFKYKVIRQAELNIGILLACITLCLPLPIFSINNVVKLSTGMGYYFYGVLAAVITSLCYCISCYYLNAFFIRKGICAISEAKLQKYWHNHHLKRKLFIGFVVCLLVSFIVQCFLTGFGNPYYLAKGTKFNDYESFVSFMEEEKSISYQYHDKSYQAQNEMVYIKNYGIHKDTRKRLFETALKDKDWNTVCQYKDQNYEVCAIKYNEKKGTILPITVITYEKFHYAVLQISVTQNIFKGIYILEMILFLLVYFRKRAK